MTEIPAIEEWITALATELGVDPDAIDLRALLDMAREVAHHVDRPAAPASAAVVGMAVGSGDADAFRAACAAAGDLARRWS